MGKTLIIAEKPDIARSIALELGATKKQDGYFEGNGYYVSYAFGHLYKLFDTVDYKEDMAKWDLKDYPFIPGEFKYKCIEDKGRKKQIGIIKKLTENSDTNMIINACDSDREAETIFSELKYNLKFNKPIKRLWISSHTSKDIQEGMANLKDELVNLEKAAYCRQQVDWIIGINLTVVFTLKAGADITLKIGRVILATLKLIFDREIEIANFKSTPFYMLKSTFKSDDEFYIGTYIDEDGKTKFLDKLKLISLQENIKNKPGIVIKKESKKVNENAPKLFNLSDVQGYITSKYKNFSSDKVLTVIQGLYEKKYLTYPRTESRCLDETLVEKAKSSLDAVIKIPELSINSEDIKFHTEKRVFDSSKVESHPALMPTYVVPELDKLSNDEKIVYLEITKRFVSQFMPAAIYDTLEIVTKVEDYEFVTKGRVLVQDGWRRLYKNDKVEEDDEVAKENSEEDKITAKNINEGSNVISNESEIKEGKTKAPAHYTEGTLLTAMENCGKKVEDEEEELKGYTIGTAATRAETIKKLLDCGYIEKKGKKLIITDLGLKIIHYFPAKKLLKTSFTGQIEKTLKNIEKGQYDSNEFMQKMIAYITQNVNEIKDGSVEIPQIKKKEAKIIGKCPVCGKNIIETLKTYTCEGTKTKECDYTLWKENNYFGRYKKKITETIAKDFITKGKATVKGMKSPKNGKPFNAVIKIEKTDKGYSFKMELLDSKKK